MNIVPQSVSLEHPVDGEMVLAQIERAGRVCYKSECRITPDSARGFIRRLLDSKHESVLEHYNISMRVICDRGVSHEIVRHRIASYSQESTRYCNYGKADEITVIQPPEMSEDQCDQWLYAMGECEKSYMQMLKKGATPQIARSVLPNSLKTELVMTMNLREWRHFLKLRTSPQAHPQMREVANMVREILIANVPIVFDEFIPAATEASNGV